MPEHIKRLLVILMLAMMLALVAKEYFTADSFGLYGHFRADSVPEIAALTPSYQGAQSCRQCHAERHKVWTQGRHQSVACENCHGAAGDHPASGKLPVPNNTRQLCAACHAAMPARPARQPQININEHAGEQQCVECHNPHSPLHFKWEEMQSFNNQMFTNGDAND